MFGFKVRRPEVVKSTRAIGGVITIHFAKGDGGKEWQRVLYL